jgi:hypothetical protein
LRTFITFGLYNEIVLKPETNILHLCRQLSWDYSIPPEDIAAVIRGEKEMAGHDDRKAIFRKALETFPWFTVLKLFEPEEINALLTDSLIGDLRMPSLRKHYAFIKKRLQETLPATG